MNAGRVAIGVGLFLWFTVAFVGGLGQPVSTGAALAAGGLFIVLGTVLLVRPRARAVRWLAVLTAVVYSPVVTSRFDARFGTDWGGIVGDALLLGFLVYIAVRKPGAPARPGLRDSSGDAKMAADE